MSQESRTHDFQFARRFRALNRLAQIFLSISLAFGLNIIAAKYFKRYDLTQTANFTLAPESKAYLRELQNPVEIIVTIPKDPEDEILTRVHADLENILREYEYASRKGDRQMISTEYVDVYKQRSRTQELANRFDLKQENQILVTSGGRTEVIRPADLYEAKDGDTQSFRGEEAFTSAILNVSSEDRQTIYFLVGHGEMRLSDVDPLRGLSQLQQFLSERSLELKELDLTQEAQVPEDADLVIAASPQAAVLPEEVEKLRRYMDGNGRMILLIDPGRIHGLDDLLVDWGVLAEDMAVFDAGPDFRASGGDFFIRNFSNHPITNFLKEANVSAMLGQPRPVRSDPGAEDDERLIVQAIMVTSEFSWAERDFRTEPSPQPTKGRDLAGPIVIATASEKRSTTQLGLNLPTGRLIVFGNSDFIANNRIQVFGNYTLITNAVNWALNRTNMLNIPSRPMTNYQMVLSEEDKIDVLLYFAILPGAILLLGTLVTFVRRR